MNAIEIINQLNEQITALDFLICLPGLTLLALWLAKTSFAKKALANSPPRRNNMGPLLPLIPLVFWMGSVWIALWATVKSVGDLQTARGAFIYNLILCICSILAAAITLYLAKISFARRLKGFGLNLKTVLKDLSGALVNLLAIWPLIVLAIVMTTFFGQLIWGQDFQMQPHEELEFLKTHRQLPTRILIIITTVAIVPAFEEMLFRGMFQTMLRSFLARPWLAIAVTSGFFAVVHANAAHWPALFILAMALGYSYEKSGSLFRPIFIHSLFNAVNIIGTLIQ
jgi:membrane protease YdiL (CAAX protease family)